MKLSKMYQGRMDGLAYAREIVAKGGLEALDHEIAIRKARFIPLEMNEERRIKLGKMISERILATFTPTVMFVLNDSFGFGKGRLLKWKDEFLKLCNMMSETDPLGAPYETAMDYAQVLKNKYGIEFDWNGIEEVQNANQQQKQLCDIDYVIKLLEEKGQPEAAKLLKEYGRRK